MLWVMNRAEGIQLSRPPERKKQAHELRVEFMRFVGESAGKDAYPDLASYPDFTISDGSINPAWTERNRQENKRVGRESPGRLIYDKEKREYSAANGNSPVGKIAEIRDSIALESIDNAQGNKRINKETKQDLVDIFNSYAGKRFNGDRDVVNMLDFSGISIYSLSVRPLEIWRQKLLHMRQQSSTPVLFERWEDADKKIDTPTRADLFFYNIFLELSHAKEQEDVQLSKRAVAYQKLSELDSNVSYKELAGMFYGGNMTKAFNNISVLAKMTGAHRPEGWHQFNGVTSEFRLIQKDLSTFGSGIEGYLAASDKLYKGDMAKTFKNISAVVNMTGGQFPEGWQAFAGTTDDFRKQQQWLKEHTGVKAEDLASYFKFKVRMAKSNFVVLQKAS